MIARPPSTASLVARIAIAYTISWLTMLLAVMFLHPLLIFASIPPLTVAIIRWTAEFLIPLSIITVPLMVVAHARMFRRSRIGPAGYVAYGASATVALFAMTRALVSRLGTGWSIFSAFGLGDLFPSYLLVAAIGAACSAVVWLFAIRPLRPNVRDLASTFD